MNIDFESRNITRRSFLKGAGVVGAAGLLSACGGSKSNNSGSTAASGAEAPNSTGATPLKEYISWESANREIESWNLLYSQTLSDANVVTNLWDGLMSFDCYGKLVPAIATSWEANEDSTVLDLPPARRCGLGGLQRRGEGAHHRHRFSGRSGVGAERLQERGQQHLHAHPVHRGR